MKEILSNHKGQHKSFNSLSEKIRKKIHHNLNHTNSVISNENLENKMCWTKGLIQLMKDK